MFSVQARTVASITLRATMGRRRALVFAMDQATLPYVTAAPPAGDKH